MGEGGNLGFTQLGRVEYALAGGLINTDAIDNSAGVDCSDHEVNIKILLDAVVAAGDLTVKQRNELLADMTDEVAELVLQRQLAPRTWRWPSRGSRPAPMVDVHARYLRSLEQEGLLDRDLEFLPDREAAAEREAAGPASPRPSSPCCSPTRRSRTWPSVLASDLPEDAVPPARAARLLPGRRCGSASPTLDAQATGCGGRSSPPSS